MTSPKLFKKDNDTFHNAIMHVRVAVEYAYMFGGAGCDVCGLSLVFLGLLLLADLLPSPSLLGWGREAQQSKYMYR